MFDHMFWMSLQVGKLVRLMDVVATGRHAPSLSFLPCRRTLSPSRGRFTPKFPTLRGAVDVCLIASVRVCTSCGSRHFCVMAHA